MQPETNTVICHKGNLPQCKVRKPGTVGDTRTLAGAHSEET